MKENDIIDLIKKDEYMMNVLNIAEKINLKDWYIGAGFIRNKVWDYLHRFSENKIYKSDIDLVYYDINKDDKNEDKVLSLKLKEETGFEWEITNEAYKNIVPYRSTEDAISQWPETATCIGVKLINKELKLFAPYGINDLVNLIIRPNPKSIDGKEIVNKRIIKKNWLKIWPNLRIEN